MEERNLYMIAVSLTEKEARALLKAAGKWGQSIGDLLSNMATDIMNGLGDEGELMDNYLERAEPPSAGESFVSFCLKNGHAVDFLEELTEDIAYHTEMTEDIRAALAAGSFPEEDGWKEGTTPEDARGELAFHEEALKDATEEKAALWKEYKEEASIWGGGLTEEEALEEARAYQREEKTWTGNRITGEALKALEERVARYDPDNSND